jgi:hypothetical protein
MKICYFDFLVSSQKSLRDPGDTTSGYIGMGDRYGNKNSGIQSFLIDAIQCGARIFDHCHVHRIIMTSTSTGRRATGVECHIRLGDDNTSQNRMTVHARRTVIVAAGALYSPCLLRKSGLHSPHIGKHLRLHPVSAVMGIFPNDQPIDSIYGAPMTTVCNQFANGLKNDGYGVKIECPCSYPGLLAAGSPWITGLVFKERMLQYRNSVPLILVQRDSGHGGSVKESIDGESLVIDYEVNPRDNLNLIASMQGAARILDAAGAHEVVTGHIYDGGYNVLDKKKIVPSEDRKTGTTSSLENYLKSIENRGMIDHEISLFSAHQMGTCRMSITSTNGVVDPNGETWECDDLYIMDSSVFPTSSGSNPMVTVLSIAQLLSTRLCLQLKLQDQEKESFSHTQLANYWPLTPDDLLKATQLSKRREALRQRNTLMPGISIGVIGAPIVVVAIAVWFFNK